MRQFRKGAKDKIASLHYTMNEPNHQSQILHISKVEFQSTTINFMVNFFFYIFFYLVFIFSNLYFDYVSN